MRDVTKLMAGKRGVIFGLANDHSIAWGIAKSLYAHGAELALWYHGSAVGKRVTSLALAVESDFLVDCDASDARSLDTAFSMMQERWPVIFSGPRDRLLGQKGTAWPVFRHYIGKF